MNILITIVVVYLILTMAMFSILMNDIKTLYKEKIERAFYRTNEILSNQQEMKRFIKILVASRFPNPYVVDSMYFTPNRCLFCDSEKGMEHFPYCIFSDKDFLGLIEKQDEP